MVLPASYAGTPARRCPVIYDFPGWGATDSTMLGHFHHDQILDRASADLGREAILVLVDTTTRLGSSYLVDSPVQGAWDTFLAGRLIPLVDARLRTVATPAGRAVFGHSTGATAPSPSAGATPSSPASDPAERRGVSWPADPATGRICPRVLARWRAHSPQAWLSDARRAAAIKAAFDRRIYLAAGEKDEFGLHRTTRAFSRALARAGIAHRFEAVRGGHTDRVHELIGPPLRFCLETLAPATQP